MENDKTLFNITNILKQKSMKKKEYQRPAMQVVEMRQQSHLLAGSVQGDRNNPYGDPEEWPTV